MVRALATPPPTLRCTIPPAAPAMHGPTRPHATHHRHWQSGTPGKNCLLGTAPPSACPHPQDDGPKRQQCHQGTEPCSEPAAQVRPCARGRGGASAPVRCQHKPATNANLLLLARAGGGANRRQPGAPGYETRPGARSAPPRALRAAVRAAGPNPLAAAPPMPQDNHAAPTAPRQLQHWLAWKLLRRVLGFGLIGRPPFVTHGQVRCSRCVAALGWLVHRVARAHAHACLHGMACTPQAAALEGGCQGGGAATQPAPGAAAAGAQDKGVCCVLPLCRLVGPALCCQAHRRAAPLASPRCSLPLSPLLLLQPRACPRALQASCTAHYGWRCTRSPGRRRWWARRTRRWPRETPGCARWWCRTTARAAPASPACWQTSTGCARRCGAARLQVCWGACCGAGRRIPAPHSLHHTRTSCNRGPLLFATCLLAPCR